MTEQQQTQIEELERENERLTRELQEARDEIAKLQGLVERYTLQLRQRR